MILYNLFKLLVHFLVCFLPCFIAGSYVAYKGNPNSTLGAAFWFILTVQTLITMWCYSELFWGQEPIDEDDQVA